MKISYLATLESSFHHGAGVAGNTARLRTQEVVLPDGSLALVPFLSANSIRHGLRSALAWHLAKTLDFADLSLSKGEVTLLWSGGGITKTGAQANLEIARQANDLIPGLGLLGYAAGSDIITGTLRVSDAILVCEENQARLPMAATHKAAHYRGEEFGTRHDLDSTPVARFMDIAAQEAGSTQMIYSLQTLKPGAQLYGDVMTDVAATQDHERTLAAAWHLWAQGGTAFLGAKTASGYGRASITTDTDVPDEVAWLTEHYLERAEEIAGVLKELAR
jgi:hypothetical protein